MTMTMIERAKSHHKRRTRAAMRPISLTRKNSEFRTRHGFDIDTPARNLRREDENVVGKSRSTRCIRVPSTARADEAYKQEAWQSYTKACIIRYSDGVGVYVGFCIHIGQVTTPAFEVLDAHF